ncbi:MAG: hypothetical protein ACYC61_00665 [Isosphaeraceae bacterium]
MKTTLTALLGLGLIALVAGPAAAQGLPRGLGALMGTYSGLLVNESVQKELQLDDHQVEKARELDEKMSEELREKFRALADVEPQKQRTRAMEITLEISTSALKAAAGFLRP